jgi:hypothetical protein
MRRHVYQVVGDLVLVFAFSIAASYDDQPVRAGLAHATAILFGALLVVDSLRFRDARRRR